MRDYGKVHTSFWTSEDTRGLTDDGRTLALYLLTSPHSNMLGCFRLPDAYIAEDTQWSPKRIQAAFDDLERLGFAMRDRTKWVVLFRFLRWNPIENPNQGKAASRLFAQIPDCEAKRAMAKAAMTLGTHLDLSIVQNYINRFETVVGIAGNQDQDQDQEQEPKQEQEAAPSALPPAPPSPPASTQKASGRKTSCPDIDQPPEVVEAWLAANDIPPTSDEVWGTTVANFLSRNQANNEKFVRWKAAWRTSAGKAVEWGHVHADVETCFRSKRPGPVQCDHAPPTDQPAELSRRAREHVDGLRAAGDPIDAVNDTLALFASIGRAS